MGNGFSRERPGFDAPARETGTSRGPRPPSSASLPAREEGRAARERRELVRAKSTSMASLNKKKTPRIFIEKKSWFLGRFLTRNLTDSSLGKLRAHVRLNKGYKTKLKLTSEGLASGAKSSGLLKSKIPYEFTPLKDIKDISTDEVFQNVLLCVFRLAEVQYEITAYRFSDETEARLFMHAYYDLIGRSYSVVPRGKPYTMNGNHVPVRAGPEEVYGYAVNWTMRERPSTDRTLEERTPANNSKLNGIYRSGVTYRRPSLNELMATRGGGKEMRLTTARGRSASPVSMRYLPDYTPDYKTYRDVAVLALLDTQPDPKFRSRPYFNRVKTYYDAEGVPHSDVSCQVCLPVPTSRVHVSKWEGSGRQDSMRRHIADLTEEVKYLRSLVTNGNNGTAHVYRGEINSDMGYRSNGTHDSGQESDSSFTSLDTVARTNLCNRIDTGVGEVKVLVDDFRRRSKLDRAMSPSKITEVSEPADDVISSNTSDVMSVSAQLNNSTTDESSAAASAPPAIGALVIPNRSRASRMRERNDIMTSSVRRTYNRSKSPHSRSSSVSHYGNVRSKSTESRYRYQRPSADYYMDSDTASVSSSHRSRRIENVYPARRNRNKPDFFLLFPGTRRRTQSASRYETRSDRLY